MTAMLLSLLLRAGTCTFDTDCTMSTFVSCCERCCPGAPHAVLKVDEDAKKQRCGTMACKGRPCDARKCRKVDSPADYRATCQASHCTAVRVSP